MNQKPTRYQYLGDRSTAPNLKGAACFAVYNSSGKCIRGKNGNMLVRFDSGSAAVVLARLLRKVPETKLNN